jgi:hypothetical protein
MAFSYLGGKIVNMDKIKLTGAIVSLEARLEEAKNGYRECKRRYDSGIFRWGYFSLLSNLRNQKQVINKLEEAIKNHKKKLSLLN